ncbi:hypothetical protein Hanom_Chr12g01161781 [Helianthus anomalus]
MTDHVGFGSKQVILGKKVSNDLLSHSFFTVFSISINKKNNQYNKHLQNYTI